MKRGRQFQTVAAATQKWCNYVDALDCSRSHCDLQLHWLHLTAADHTVIYNCIGYTWLQQITLSFTIVLATLDCSRSHCDLQLYWLHLTAADHTVIYNCIGYTWLQQITLWFTLWLCWLKSYVFSDLLCCIFRYFLVKWNNLSFHYAMLDLLCWTKNYPISNGQSYSE